MQMLGWVLITMLFLIQTITNILHGLTMMFMLHYALRNNKILLSRPITTVNLLINTPITTLLKFLCSTCMPINLCWSVTGFIMTISLSFMQVLVDSNRPLNELMASLTIWLSLKKAGTILLLNTRRKTNNG